MPYAPPPDLAAMTLAQMDEAIAARHLPPVDMWQPVTRGDSLMRIAADGTWYHDGGVIRRPAMVRAFAALLRRDGDGQHWLVTPHEMQAIAVDDAAFIAADMAVRHRDDGTPVIAFRLNTDDIVLAGPDHRLRAAGDPAVPALYLAVRHGTEARLNRSTYGQLIDHALEVSSADAPGVASDHAWFSLLPGAA